MTKPLKNPRLIKIQSQANIVTQTCQTLCGWSLGDKWRHSGGPMWVLFAGLRSFCELAHSVELPISLPMTLTPCVYCEMCLIKPPSQSEAGFSPPSTCLISLPQTGTLKRFTWQNIISVPQNAAHLWHTSPFTTWWTWHNRATNTLPCLLRFSLFHLELLHLTPKYLLKLVFKMSNKSLFIYKYKTSRAFLVVQW